MLLIKNATIYAPNPIGKKDILICEENIIYISDNINVPKKDFPMVEVLDASKLIAVPGLIDLHVHIIGGGGEAGFTSRAPELMLSQLTTCGVTTCVGLLGTDGTTRNMANLIAKARSLELEGISTYVWTGSYQVPTRTITDSARGDIILVDKIIGIGEIAISDHRASHPSEQDLAHLASEARLGGMLSGKCGVLHVHLGDGKEGMKPIISLINNTDIPFDNILPTHINRNPLVFKQGEKYALDGGFIDITTGIKPEGDNAIYPAKAYKEMLESGVSPEHVTMSSDAGGSLPIFDKDGKLIKLGIGTPKTNIECVRECVMEGLPLETALLPLTSNPAKILKLRNKGKIDVGFNADILLLDKDLEINTVISKGNVMVSDYKVKVYGNFEVSRS